VKIASAENAYIVIFGVDKFEFEMISRFTKFKMPDSVTDRKWENSESL